MFDQKSFIDKRICSHAVLEIRLKTGKIRYDCRSEDDICAGCARDGLCPFEDEEGDIL